MPNPKGINQYSKGGRGAKKKSLTASNKHAESQRASASAANALFAREAAAKKKPAATSTSSGGSTKPYKYSKAEQRSIASAATVNAVLNRGRKKKS